MHRVIDDTGTLSTPLKTLCRLRAALWNSAAHVG